MSISNSVTAACTETSSAETGSSATTTSGLPAKARAMPMRCFCPPESWRGMRRSNSRGSLTRSSSSSIRARRSGVGLADAEFLQRADDLRRRPHGRVERVERVLEHHLDRATASSSSRLLVSMTAISLCRAFTSPEVFVSSPISTLASVDFPQPDSPTMRHGLRSRAPEGDRLVRLHGAHVAAAENRVGRRSCSISSCRRY